MGRLHADELAIDVGLARRLVDRSFPPYAGLPLVPLADSGSSNALFRLGQDMLVRLPRQPGGGRGIVKEAAWLPFVAGRVTASVPQVLGVGEPGFGYPEAWALTTWLDGARVDPNRGESRLALDLARFVTELRAAELPDRAWDDASLSWYRGRPLWRLDDQFREVAGACRPLDLDLDLDAAVRVWDDAVAASRTTAAVARWFHGDLLVENLLVDESGALSAVLDFGSLGIGDPSVDLVVAWEALDDAGRNAFRQALNATDAMWAASRGWAVFIALMTFPYYGATMPARCGDRLAMARAAIAG